jgi:hypothetical protein
MRNKYAEHLIVTIAPSCDINSFEEQLGSSAGQGGVR